MKFTIGIRNTSFTISSHRPFKEIKQNDTDKPVAPGLMRFSPIKLTSRPKWATQDRALAKWAEGKDELSKNYPITADERTERREVASMIHEFNTNKKETILNIQDKKLISSLPPIPAKTKKLYINGCENLKAAPDLSKCTDLTYADLSWNRQMPETVDTTHCPALKIQRYT